MYKIYFNKNIRIKKKGTGVYKIIKVIGTCYGGNLK